MGCVWREPEDWVRTTVGPRLIYLCGDVYINIYKHINPQFLGVLILIRGYSRVIDAYMKTLHTHTKLNLLE